MEGSGEVEGEGGRAGGRVAHYDRAHYLGINSLPRYLVHHILISASQVTRAVLTSVWTRGRGGGSGARWAGGANTAGYIPPAGS